MRLFIALFLLQLSEGSQVTKSSNFLPVLGKWMRHTRQSGYRPAGPPPGLPSGGVTVQPQAGGNSAGYSPGSESDSAVDIDSPIDLHNKEFCVDVSTYQPVVWEEREGEACRTEWQMQCEDKAEKVCADISETRCDVSHTI